MAPKRALFLSYGNDEKFNQVKEFIEEAGVLLEVRDMAERPLNERELYQLIGHLEITHFLNKLSSTYTKHNLDKDLPSRAEVIKLMVEDYTLIRQPIVKSSRLLTIGCDKKKIAEMLLINANGQQPEEGVALHSNKGNRTDRRSAHASR